MPGDLERVRTFNLRIRSAVLYPVELRSQYFSDVLYGKELLFSSFYTIFTFGVQRYSKNPLLQKVFIKKCINSLYGF
jgi:hypothetical protein